MRLEAKYLKAVSRAASKELGRYAIDGVHFDGKRAAATDGRMLLVAPLETDEGEHVTPRIVTKDGIKAALSDKSVKAFGLNLSSNGSVSFKSSLGPAPIEAHDPRKVEFPSVDDIVRDENARPVAFQVRIAASVLAALAAAASDAVEEGPCVTFTFSGFSGDFKDKPDATKAIRVTFNAMRTGEAAPVHGVAMPVSI